MEKTNMDDIFNSFFTSNSFEVKNVNDKLVKDYTEAIKLVKEEKKNIKGTLELKLEENTLVLRNFEAGDMFYLGYYLALVQKGVVNG